MILSQSLKLWFNCFALMSIVVAGSPRQQCISGMQGICHNNKILSIINQPPANKDINIVLINTIEFLITILTLE